jgi:hypothetical protein
MLVVRLLLLAACALVAGCAPGGTSAPPDASPVVSPAGGPPSVTGTVTAGPVCPVERNPPDPGCAPRPVPGAVILATDASGQEVGRTTSAADGSYRLIVGETGSVVISASHVDGLVGEPAPVTVLLDSPSEVEHLDLEYDTGIR